MAAVTRLGAEIAAARSAPRGLRAAPPLAPQPAAAAPGVLRAATRLARQRAAAAPSAPEPAPAAAPRLARDPVAAPAPSVETPAGMSDWEAAWIFGGDAGKAIAMSNDDAEARAALD